MKKLVLVPVVLLGFVGAVLLWPPPTSEGGVGKGSGKVQTMKTMEATAGGAGLGVEAMADGVPASDAPTTQAGAMTHVQRMGQAPEVVMARPLPADFLETISADGQSAEFTLTDGRRVTGTVSLTDADAEGRSLIQGAIVSPAAGWFYFQRVPKQENGLALMGWTYFEREEVAHVVAASVSSEPVLAQRAKADVICFLPAYKGAAQEQPEPLYAPQDHPSAVPVPGYQNGIVPLQSNPKGRGVLYLDLDGETGPWAGWPQANVVAKPIAGWSPSSVKAMWKRVAEDFAPFQLNVTTDLKVYQDAPTNGRIRCVFLSNPWENSWGGVAFVNSFSNGSGGNVIWVRYNGANGAAVASHELGHALGLRHDGRTAEGEEYYDGHGGTEETSWGPIMGSAGYTRKLDTWSNGDYADASNTQDDFTVIANNTQVGVRVDDAGDTYAAAAHLNIRANGAVVNEGIITRRADVDLYRFSSKGGGVNLSLRPVTDFPNLDILATLHRADGTEVLRNNPETAVAATLATTLTAGDYYVKVDGTGKGDPLGTGYSDYGMMGAYYISGTVSNAVTTPWFTIAENGATGATVGTVVPLKAHTGPVAYSLVSGNTNSLLTINPSTGVLTTTATLNYETLAPDYTSPALFQLVVRVTDTLDATLNEDLRVLVEVTDVNEPPTFTYSQLSISIFANTPPGLPLPTNPVGVADPDHFDGVVNWTISEGNTAGHFSIDPASGRLAVAKIVPQGVYPIKVRATDFRTPTHVVTKDLMVTVAPPVAGDYELGGATQFFWTGISGTSITSLNTAVAAGPANRQKALKELDSANEGDGYGSVIRTWFIPPSSGNYFFHIAGDDAAELWFRNVPDQDTGAVRIANHTASVARYAWQTNASQRSASQSLLAGRAYYLEARHKEGTGADHIAVAWQNAGGGPIQVIPAAYLAPVYKNEAPVITTASSSVREGVMAGAGVVRIVATDFNAEETSVFAITGGNAAGIFGLEPATGLLFVAKPELLDDTVTPTHTLSITATDNGRPAKVGTKSLSVFVIDQAAPPRLVQEIWEGIPGDQVSNLRSAPAFSRPPTRARNLTRLSIGSQVADNYGSRIRGYIKPIVISPATSQSYNFYIASTGGSELWLSTNESPAAAAVIAQLSTPVEIGDFTAGASQKSAVRTLVAGQRYYFEIIHKAGEGNDHLSVGWNIGAATTISTTLGEGLEVEAFQANTAPVFNGVGSFRVNEDSPVGAVVGTVTAMDSGVDFVTYSISGGNPGGALEIHPRTGILTVANPAAFPASFPVASAVISANILARDTGMNAVLPLRDSSTTISVRVASSAILSPVSEKLTVVQGTTLALHGRPADDADGPVGTAAWSVGAGSSVAFGEASAPRTTATFATLGTHVVRFNTADGAELALDECTVTVIPAATVGLVGSVVGSATVSPPPSFSELSEVYTIRAEGAAGVTSGTTADGGYFVQRLLVGDGAVVGRVTSVQNVAGSGSRAGIMMRSSANVVNAAHMYCGITSLLGGRAVRRNTAGATSVAEDLGTLTLPYWFRITRTGTRFVPEMAPDDQGVPGIWRAAGAAQDLTLPENLNVGMMATSAQAGSAATAQMDSFSVIATRNLAPRVAAGADQTLAVNTISLAGSSLDDGLPELPRQVTTAWSMVSGPGAAVFTEPTVLDTGVTFPTSGTYVLRLSASDGDAVSVDDVRYTVALASPFLAWRTANFPLAVISDLTISGPAADPDGDGLPNLVEYALGLSPHQPSQAELIVPRVDGGHAVFAYRPSIAATDVSFHVETSADLAGWSALPAEITAEPVVSTPGTFAVRVPLPPDGPLFLRLAVRLE